MFRYSILIILALILISYSNTFANDINWISLTSNYGSNIPAKTQIIEENNDSIVIDMTLNGMNVEQKTVNGEVYQMLSVPMSAWTNETGKPKLPVIRSLVVAPSDGDIQISIENSDYIELSNYNIYPVGKQVIKNGINGSVYIDEDFTIDRNFYKTDDLYPQKPAIISYSGYMREQRIVQLEFHPLMFRPLSKKLVCYSYMRVRLKFDNSFINKLSTGLLRNNIGDSISGNVSMAPQNNSLRMGTVSYPEELMETKDADYLIIAAEPFYGSAKLKQLAEWRASYSGLNVIVAPIDKIYYRFGSINTPEASIRDFVRYAYNFWKSSNSNDGKIRYVLIIGDTEYIPVKISNRMSFDEYIATDNWYACVSGDDLFPDVMIGRLPAKSLSELSIMIDKIIQYEQNPLYGEWANNALLMLGTVEVLRQDLEYARDEYLLPDGYNITELAVLDGHNSNNVISALNKGQYIVDYAGHGYVNMWEIMNSADIAKLNNSRMLPAIFSLACSTGYFDHPEKDSLAEAFVKSRNGAIAFFGASRLASISSIGFGLSSAIAGSHIYNLGEITMSVKLNLLPFSTDLELYNLMGDPALDMGAPRRRPNTPDIAISASDIQFEPENPKQGEIVTISVSIGNYGAGDANNVVIEFRDGGILGNIIEKKNLSIIRAGTKANVSINWKLAFGTPLHNVFIKAYSIDGPVEYYGENNDAQKQLIVSLEKDGYPIKIADNSLSAPVTYDIDGDGMMEIIFQNYSYDRYNRIYILKADGKNANGWPKSIYRSKYDYQTQYSNSSVGISPSIGDIDGDGNPEIVSAFFSPEVYAWKFDGTPLDGWPVKVNGYASTTPVLADVNQDGLLDVIVGTTSGQLYIFKYNGEQVDGFPINTGKMGHLFPAIADLDGDSDIEIIAYDSLLPRNFDDNRESSLYAWHHDGKPVSGFPVRMKGAEAVLPPITGDLDGDGKSEIIAISTWSQDCRINIWSGNGILKVSMSINNDDIRSAPALADIDGDGDVEILATSYDSFLYAWHHDGRLVYSFPKELKNSYWLSSPSFVDVDGDGRSEIISISHGGIIFAYNADGSQTTGWPAIVRDQTSSTPPAIADIDNDTKLDLVYLSGNGYVHALSLISNTNDNINSNWTTFLYDERHTGCYGSSSILPPAPNNPQAYDTPDDKGGSITISWEFPSGDINITNYTIFRSDKADGKYTIIGKTEKNKNIFMDNDAEIGVTYWYMVRSSNGTNMSSNTNPVSAYSFNNFSPNAPVSVYINNIIIDGVIDIWWKMNEEPNIAGYKVYFGPKSQNYDKTFDAGLVNHYAITALENNKEYFLCVTAYDKDGNESLKSTEVSAIPRDEDTDPPVFSSFYPSVVVENSEFYIRCEIKDESGIYDDNTTDKGQGVYLIWDVDELSEDSNIVSMSKLRSDEYVTDNRIPGQLIGSNIVYKVIAYDNDFDWGRVDDRTKGVSEQQKIEFTSAPKKVYNYPNPAPSGAYTDSTIFHYYVDTSSQVKINVYDISGNLVDSINEQTTSGGHKETEWNISNIASGIYIYTIEIQPDSGNKQLYKNKLAILK